MFVRVKFSENSKVYEYRVPNHLVETIKDYVPNYAIVEDHYSNFCRYKVVRILEIYNATSPIATQPIVDFVDSREYVQYKKNEKIKENLVNDIIEQVDKIDNVNILQAIKYALEGGSDII